LAAATSDGTVFEITKTGSGHKGWFRTGEEAHEARARYHAGRR
jgi:hypothetical protein